MAKLLLGLVALVLPLTAAGMRTKIAQAAVARLESNLTADMEATLKASRGRNPPETHWNNFGQRPPEIPRGWQVGRPKAHSYGLENTLVPGFVAPPGAWYQWRVREQTNVVETNEYDWELEVANGQYLGWRVAKLRSEGFYGWASAMFGHQEVTIYNGMNQPQFKIRNNKFVWNPFQRRWSFRILPPWSEDPNDALYTINKDQFGRGVLWLRDEWRIYRGRERDNDMAYYCIGSYFGWNWWFYRNKAAYDMGDEPIAEISQKWNAGAFIGASGGMGESLGGGVGTWLPDKFKLRVHSGEDSALLMAVATIIDMVHDQEERDEAADRAEEHHHEPHHREASVLEKSTVETKAERESKRVVIQECPSQCAAHPGGWSYVCTNLAACKVCSQCGGNPTPTPAPASCPSSCAAHPGGWSYVCKNEYNVENLKPCKECKECGGSGSDPVPSPAPVECHAGCSAHPGGWEYVCQNKYNFESLKSCKACPQCGGDPVPTPAPVSCPSSCSSHPGGWSFVCTSSYTKQCHACPSCR